MLFAIAAVAVLAAAISVPSPSPSPSPAPSASPAVLEIGRVRAPGRSTNLVGHAESASQGTINQEQISTRPVLRPGEILEAIPGLVISQHSGEGKANQYYLRGFQLDHGTDLAATIAGIPVNMPSHAHGQGYSDINWLMPEVVGFVTFKKGPYYADEGDFSTAGAYDLFYRNTIPQTASFGIGTYGYDRLFVADSPRVGRGNLLYAFELYRDNGTLDRPDEYKKVNGVLRFSRVDDASSFAITAQAYRGDFNSSDQIPQRLVDAGTIDRFGLIDPSDGGRTFRYALSTEYQHNDAHGMTNVSAYGLSYGLNLYSNFTYFLDDSTDYYNVTSNPTTCNALYSTCTPGPQHLTTYTSYCPANVTATGMSTAPRSVTPNPFAFACGDQREQEDKRFVAGFKAEHTFEAAHASTSVGVGLRNDNIYEVGLFLTHDQVPWPNGTLSGDRVVERDLFAYAQSELRLGSVRLTGGLRADSYHLNVTDFQPANSGSTNAALISPKFGAAFRLGTNQEFYLNYGMSFHSNDGRGINHVLDPQTHATIDASGGDVQSFSPLVRAWGEEVGYRYSSRRLTTTLAAFKLNIASELVFQGDGGTTTPSGPTVRKGLELTNYFRATRAVTLDADVATSTARFLTDPDGAGTFVPESLNVVTSAGVTYDVPSFAVSLRYRYFGPRVLDQLGAAVSSPTSLVNAQITLKGKSKTRLTLDVFNLLNASGDDVEYSYGSWLPQDAKNPAYASDSTVNPTLGGGGVNDYHFHPTLSRVVRLTYSVPF